jgi:glycosyltransferase involved in cell wall biosynthesis
VDQDRIDDPWIAKHLTRRSAEWFDAHAGLYDRVVYQFGNSPFHQHMFGLLRRHPGVVVLHEMYLAHVIDHCEHAYEDAGLLERALYRSHGYGALLHLAGAGRDAAMWEYPCTREVLDAADGVIVHSRFAEELADRWFGAGSADDWSLIPLCRQAPPAPDRGAARRTLGLTDEDLLVCSFGILGSTKLNHRLLDSWTVSTLASDPRCRLVFVGEAPQTPYCSDLVPRAEAAAGSGVSITGFVSRERYETYLAAADIAVQLRASSRGETSAAVLDCLAHGAATVVNRHGWAAELPPDVAVSVGDEFATQELSSALERLAMDAGLRRDLGARGAALVASEHSPSHAAELYRQAIEGFEAHGERARYRRLVREAAEAAGGAQPARAEIVAAARSIAAARPLPAPRRLFVDVSALALMDLKTGIQRVARAVLKRLVDEPPDGYRIEPVREQDGGFVYARSTACHVLGIPPLPLEDAPVEAREGDVFLGLDLAFESVRLGREALLDFRARGIRVVHVVYDLLPVLRPEWFPAQVGPAYESWLRIITAESDGLVCISRTVADEVIAWMERERPARLTPLTVGFFHLGADLEASLPSDGVGPDAEAVLAGVRTRPTFLMVGTVEPRKGHRDALDAMEELWARGVDAGLVIVGREGWDTHDLFARLRTHPERGRRLAWLETASDEALARLYEASVALLAASEGEGFGLPLVESAQRALPVIARDLPVFREVAGEHAFYFEGGAPQVLADSLEEWLRLAAGGEAPPSADMPWLTWAQSTEQLLAAVLGGEWYSVWPGEAVE